MKILRTLYAASMIVASVEGRIGESATDIYIRYGAPYDIRAWRGQEKIGMAEYSSGVFLIKVIYLKDSDGFDHSVGEIYKHVDGSRITSEEQTTLLNLNGGELTVEGKKAWVKDPAGTGLVNASDGLHAYLKAGWFFIVTDVAQKYLDKHAAPEGLNNF